MFLLHLFVDQNVQCKNIVKLVCYEEVDGELFWKICKASLTSCSFPQIDRICMRGPGGQGEVEVAVSGVVDQICRKGLSFSAVVRRSYEGMIPLKCCLMSISLPWEYTAYNLLFKESPPLNM
ncbi:putative protein isoform X2 [Capsicum chacoense]